MDLKRWCKFRCACVLLLLICFNAVVISENLCTPGLKTPGYTVPQGDIIIQYGDPLDLTCVVYEKHGPEASQFLVYKRNDEFIPREMIEVLNSTSIRLHIDKPPKVTTDSYTCLLRNRSVCMNFVTVGTKPQLVDDFECIGYNYDNLTCTWTPPQNYVKTTYNLTFSLRGRASRYVNNDCPEMKYPKKPNEKMSCFWNISTTPQYRQAHQEFYFTLTMSNDFGTNQINKTFKHFQHVLSGPPENLTTISTTSSSIYLSWVVPYSMQSFPPGVHHRVLYQCEYGEKIWHVGGLITDQTDEKVKKFNLTGLKYAHALCDIRVSIRSADALADDESMWSRNSSITVRTSSKVPDEPPKTNIGSFEIVAFGNNLQFREAYIYWQQIAEEQKNGPDFKYYISVEGNNSIQPVEVTNAYAKFKNLSISISYMFNIWSRNSNGKSHQKSTVYIPQQSDRISEPLSFTKVEFGDGKYELTWEPPKGSLFHTITNYTIFWCNNERDRPYQCTGKLNWKVVPSDRTVHNETVEKNKIYQFAISANGPNSSSGMLWAACTVIHNKNMGKMKNVWINRLGSTFIEVGWKLDCSDRIGSVEGFIIYYCPILSPTQIECKGPQNNVTFYGDTSVLGGNITDLTPYTTYMLTIAVITKHTTFSQQSDPLFNTTLEAAPSSPPQDLQVTEVTNSSISIQWRPPVANNGILKYYKVQYNNQTKKIDPKTNLTLSDLASYENYLISIEACTILCSNKSKTLNVTTKMGYPGKIRQPSVTFQNDSFIIILWDKPSEARGRNDYYEVQIKQKHQHENVTVPLFNVTSRKYSIEHCGDGGKYNTFYIAVRAINIINGKPFEGPWSDELESYCRTPSNYLIYIVIAAAVAGFFSAMAYMFNKLYKHCKIMRDVEVKLPPGLAPVVTDHTLVPWSAEKRQEERDPHSPPDEELLLVKMSEPRHLSGDSSGCSSGHESVTSSLEGTHISSGSDSGTEQPAATNNYCVLGVDPALTLKTESPYVAISSLETMEASNKQAPSSPYKTMESNMQVPPYKSCEVSSQNSSPYVMTGDAVKSINPGYLPFNQEPIGKSTGYVVAGTKNNCNGMTPSGYVVAGSMNNCK